MIQVYQPPKLTQHKLKKPGLGYVNREAEKNSVFVQQKKKKIPPNKY